MTQLNFDLSPFKELESPPQDFGKPAIEAKNWFSNLSAHVADSPIAFSLSKLYEVSKQPKPPGVDLYERFDVWLVPNRVNVIKKGGIAEPISVGIETEYRNDTTGVDLNSGITCSIVSLLPTPQYVNVGGIGADIGGSIGFTGELNLNSSEVEFVKELLRDGKLKIGAHSGLEAHLKFNLSVDIPVISAVGIGSSRAEWIFGENSTSLYGQDLETWTVIALPKRKRELSYRIKLYLVMRTAYFKTRRESPWTTINCKLGNL